MFWPDISSQTAAEKAGVAATRTQALASYVAGGVEALVPPHPYLTLVLGMTDDEAQAVLDEATAVDAPEEELEAEEPSPEEDGEEGRRHRLTSR